MRDYGVIFTRYWTHPELKALDDQSKLLGCYLLSGPHSTILGAYRLPIKYVEADLGWDSETVSKGFRNHFETGFALRCEETDYVLLPNYLKWNPIANPNQGKALEKLFGKCPKNFKYYRELVHSLLSNCNKLSEPFRNGFETVSKRFRNQDQDQDQDNSLLSSIEDNRHPQDDSTFEGSKSNRHFSNQVGRYRDDLLGVLHRFNGNRSSKVNVYAWIQRRVNAGNAHPKALISILRKLDAKWDGIDNYWAWLETVFKQENGNFHAAEFQKEAVQFKVAWETWSKSDKAAEIIKRLNLHKPT